MVNLSGLGTKRYSANNGYFKEYLLNVLRKESVVRKILLFGFIL